MPDSEQKLLTIKQAADHIGIPYWKLLRAVNQESIPHYTLLNSRKLVRLTDIFESLHQGNGHE